MGPLVETRCPRCARHLSGTEHSCTTCGWLLRREERPEVAASVPDVRSIGRRVGAPLAEAQAIGARAENEASGSAWEPWLFLGIGLVTAPVFALTPILKFMGWFLASLVHEIGHAAVAWLFGMPAVPAISLAGHAAAVHQEQSRFLVALVGLGLGAAAWRFLAGAWRWSALALVGIVYPALALTGGKELVHLAAGHGAELAFATLCLWKALDGGFTDSRLERGLYGTVGWYLLGRNAFLAWGLFGSAAAREEYGSNGSFGLTNDLLRIAEEVLGWRLESVALVLLAAAILVVPAAIAFWRLTHSLRRA